MVGNNKKKSLIITIDGPAGAGKSTVARELAQKLDYKYINTGDLYRYLTYCALCANMDINNAQAMNELSRKMVQNYMSDYSYQDLLSNLQSIAKKIHSPEVNKKVSLVARHSLVRKNLIPLQRALSQDGEVVIEGRDIGTVILPNADIKFFLTADQDTRIMRRFKELQEKGFQVSWSEVKREIKSRDYIDSKRKTAPLIIPEDAILINTSNKNVKDVVCEMLKIITRIRGHRKCK